MRATQSRQKSYADRRRRPLEFEAGDHVFLRITQRIGPVAYEIALPAHLANLHNVFHMSQLRKYIAYPSHVFEADDIQVRDDLTMDVRPLQILDSQVKQLRGKEIETVTVLWDEATQEMTWEMKDLMRQSYPHLFPGKL
ncbi:uncharacterized protein LOC114165253 [Vigna unguiculata]|uniref:uncharacterized protein LOC114165253 n=1 Tax=Vigna unguiculata TaxID=3917 RepID=UPI001015EAF5|nr:uncharacterized protein LOC114165253 [Vigna unguiculata]